MMMMEMTEDMMGEIFLWLPVKSISRFKCLSKVWYEQISGRRSSFRRNYLSAFATKRETRIIGSDDPPPTMLGCFFQKKYDEITYRGIYDRVRFLPAADTTNNITEVQQHHDIFSLDEDPLGFIWSHHDPATHQKIYVAASCNGFLVCSLEKLNPVNYYLCNPVTKEWLPLPKPKNVQRIVVIGFFCKGYDPCLDMIEYTIVRAMTSHPRNICADLPIEILCNGDDEWRQFTINNPLLSPFHLRDLPQPVILSTNTDDIILCCLVSTMYYGRSAVLMFSIKSLMNPKAAGDEESFHLQLCMIEAPGSDNNSFRLYHDYIEGLQGVLHYSRRIGAQRLEKWVLNMDTGEWVCKNRVSFKTMIERSPWIKRQAWGIKYLQEEQRYPGPILAFHPANPNMILLGINQRKMWCNMESELLELASVYVSQRPEGEYYYFTYQWPCWPPLL